MDPLALKPRHRTFGSSSTRKIDRPGLPLTAPRAAGVSNLAPPKAVPGASWSVLSDCRRA